MKIITEAFSRLSLIAYLLYQPPLFEATPCDEYDVVIAGLGWAGIGAMYELQLFNNYTTNSSPSGINGPPITYIGIEAADYYGGRIVAGELVSGAEKNPIGLLIFELFSQNKNDDNYLLYSHQTWSDIYFSQDGRAMPQKKVSNARTAWANAYECLQREGRDDTRSMADVLRTDCGWNPAARSPLENLFSFYELDWEFVLDPEFASAKGNLPMWTYYLMQGKDWFVSSEGKYHADGSIDVPPNLATVADKAVKAYITNYGQITERTMLNTEIDKVIWGDGTDDCVVVQYAGGSESVIAKKTLVTFSISALVHAEENNMFDPRISSKTSAIKSTFYIDKDDPASPFYNSMGLYKLLFVQLSQDLWNRATIPNNEFIFDVPHENAIVGKCSKWQSFDRFQGEFFDGSRAFACTLVTEDFKELASKNDPNDGLDDANAMALIGRLFRVLGISASCERANPTVTPPLIDLFNPVGDLGGYDCLYQIDDGINGGNRWRGAWSTLVPYWNQQDYDEIMAPMAPIEDPDNPKLFFAGEAYCPVWVGFQHGAWDSGRLQAREMLFELNQFQDTDKDEWKRYSDAFLTSPRCDIPDGVTPPIRKSKTVP